MADPCDESIHVSDKACIAVLAAGRSSRMGAPKQLAAFDGEPLVRRACACALATGARRVCLVTGAYADVVAGAVADLPVSVVCNDEWETGQASSVKRAVAFCREAGMEFLALYPVDMPLVASSHFKELFRAIEGEGVRAAASYASGKAMAPCVFAQASFDALDALSGDRGAARIVRDPLFAPYVATVAFDDASMAFDVDTRNDLERLERICTLRSESCSREGR